ncbi:MAG: hypothetical protein N2109_03200 [Fimbriimonadales bacterium]|nr:hypothetical protein [Fimbriimonadales bacterium]
MKALTGIVAAAALFGFSGAAFAQETKPIGLSVRIGGFFPQTSDAKDEADVWFAAGLEYKLSDLNLGQTEGYTSHLSLSADWYESGDFRGLPVLVNYVGMKNQFFYSVGAGLSFAKWVGRNGTDEDSIFAYSVAIGYQFQQGQTPAFVEARYFGNEKSDLDGFVFSVGVRL